LKTNLARAIVDRCDEVSQTLKSLSHPIRVKVLCQVLDSEKSVNELTELCGVSQSSMSQFLSRMKAEGIVSSRRDGAHVFYGVADPKLVKLLRAIKEIYC
jgi:ArsR family transcriptional regulator